MDNVEKAATILSNFDFEGATSCNVGVYFRQKKGRVIGSRLVYPNNSDGDFFNWSFNQWKEFIDEKKTYHQVARPEDVVAMRIEFRIDDAPGATNYCVELTNLTQKKSFDRVVFMDPPIADMYLTVAESEALHGVMDVVELCDKVSKIERQRRRMIGSNLPEAML